MSTDTLAPDALAKAAQWIDQARYMIAFTGAGISAESGIPTYRGPGGIWEQDDSSALEIEFFRQQPELAWASIRSKFYANHQQAQPNAAHRILARWQTEGRLKDIITQNIDYLHQSAGAHTVHEFHGTLHTVSCMVCGAKHLAADCLQHKLPRCTQCSAEGNILKPDFVFFGEDIPPKVYERSMQAVDQTDLVLIIGTSGLVVPAANLPKLAKHHGARLLEINLQRSAYTYQYSNLFLQGRATEVLGRLQQALEAR